MCEDDERFFKENKQININHKATNKSVKSTQEHSIGPSSLSTTPSTATTAATPTPTTATATPTATPITMNKFLGGPGYDQYQVPLALFQHNRHKLAQSLAEYTAAVAAATTTTATGMTSYRRRRYFVTVKGGISPTRYDTDHEPIFRQESYFWWLTGVREPDCKLILTIDLDLDLDLAVDTTTPINDEREPGRTTTTTTTKQGGPQVRTILFVPELPPEYATIMGTIRTRTEWQTLYGVDEVLFTHQLETYLQHELVRAYHQTFADEKDDDHNGSKDVTAPPQILVLQGHNTDSGMLYDPDTTLGGGPCFCANTVLRYVVSHPRRPAEDEDGDNEEDTTTHTDTPPTTPWINTELLYPLLATCRVTKSSLEFALLEHVTQITSFAHAYVMKNVQADNTMYEYQCESLFKHYTYYNYGSRLTSYTSICGCGPNSAILHYGHTGEPNSRRIGPEDHCLFDMGAEYQCYASDITCSFPANGKFDAKYRAVYECVLNAQRAVYRRMRPGISWVECHIVAELEIIKGLYTIGIVTIPESEQIDPTDTVAVHTKLEELVRHDEHRLGAVFMPHGLGHLIGIDTHDVGGYIDPVTNNSPISSTNNTTAAAAAVQQRLLQTPPRSTRPGLKSLRTARRLEVGIVVTVEPGCYFIDHLLNEALQPTNYISKYLNKELINTEYRGYGGVRLEDVVTIRSSKNTKQNTTTNDDTTSSASNTSADDGKDDGADYYLYNMTLCPRTVNEIEHVMAGGKWPPMKDDAPELCRKKLTDTNISPLPSPPSK